MKSIVRTALLAVAALAPAALAQQVVVSAGTSSLPLVDASASFAVPLVADLSAAPGLTIRVLSGELRFDEARFRLDSLRSAPVSGVSMQYSHAGFGVVNWRAGGALAGPAPQVLLTAWFSAINGPGGGLFHFIPQFASSIDGIDVLSQVTARDAGACIGRSLHWGDVNGDDGVNIIDAQQIARFTVQLPVLDAAAVAQRGDVNADNAVNVIDAQQVARFTVGMTATVRTGTITLASPAVASLRAIDAADVVSIPGTVSFSVMPLSAGGVDLAGCTGTAVSWATSDTSLATIDEYGILTGRSPGMAMVTARSVSNPAVTLGLPLVVGTSGMRVHITEHVINASIWPVTADRFVVMVDTGAAAPIVATRRGADLRSGTVAIAVPAGRGYRVRVAAADSIGNASEARRFEALYRMGGRTEDVTVPSRGFSDVDVVLERPLLQMSVSSDNMIGATLPTYALLDDPAGIARDCDMRWGRLNESYQFSGGYPEGAMTMACAWTVDSSTALPRMNATLPITTRLDTMWVRSYAATRISLPDSSVMHLYLPDWAITHKPVFFVPYSMLVEQLAGTALEASASWWNANQRFELGGLDVMADVLSPSSVAGFGPLAAEPRVAFDMTPGAYTLRLPTTLWQGLEGAAGLANFALFQSRQQHVFPDSIREQLETWLDFSWAAARSSEAMAFDRAWVSGDYDLPSRGGLRPFTEVRDTALAHFDRVIERSRDASWTLFPGHADVLGGGPGIPARAVAQMASSLAARTLVLTPRSGDQATSIDWSRVRAYAEHGITADIGLVVDDFGYYSRDFTGLLTLYRVDQRVIHAMDPTQPAHWSDGERPPLATSPDARLGTDFKSATMSAEYQALPTYLLGDWIFRRYENAGSGRLGYASLMIPAENDLMLAEALIRTGGDLGRAADLVNRTRVGRGHLPAVTSAGVPQSSDCLPRGDDGSCGSLLDAVRYERLIELFGSNAMIAWGDARRFETLQPGTPRSLPVPVIPIVYEGMVPYTFGGVGNPDGRDPHP